MQQTSSTELEPFDVFDAALDAIVVMSASGAVQAWNPSAERIFGFTRAEALGRDVAKLLIPPDLRKRHYDGLERYLRTGEGPVLNRHVELRALHREGHEIPVELTIIPVQRAGGPVFYAFVRDIADRLEARKARLQSEKKFELLVQGVTDYAIYMIDRDGHVMNWNSGAQRLKGYTAEEIIGTHFSQFYTAEDREAGAPGEALRIAEREGRFETESLAVRGDGSKFMANVVIKAIRDDAGALIGFAMVTRDISERYRSEKARQDAESASEAKTHFLASMSHEIRTPLNAIIGYTDLLFDQDLKPEQRRLLDRVRFAGAALLTVVNDILDFSKIEAGQIEINPQPFSLHPLIDNTVSVIADVAQRKGLAMQVYLDPAMPKALVGDEARIRQILLNLLNNAVKFTQQGSITLHVGCHGPTGDLEQVRFSVRDTGIGIPQDQRKHLFHHFHQVNPSDTREFGGTGLGLAISKRLVELMGGNIGLESEEQKGSTFWFTVPLHRADESAIPRQVAAVTAHEHVSARILLVEDLEHNRDLARMILTNAGHEVDTAENGAQAVAAVQAKTYDVVLMDVQMPVMDGVTATKKIRELDHPAKHIPIIAMTANVLPRQVQAFGEAGMNDHVGKPFKRAQLLKKLNTWIVRAAATPSSAPPRDTASFDDVRDLMGPEWVKGGLTRLQQQIEETFGEEAAALPDREQLARRAHALASHAAILGFRELAQLCMELEEACLGGQDLASPFQQARAVARVADDLASQMLNPGAKQRP